jgi:hypothetical protein
LDGDQFKADQRPAQCGELSSVILIERNTLGPKGIMVPCLMRAEKEKEKRKKKHRSGKICLDLELPRRRFCGRQ